MRHGKAGVKLKRDISGRRALLRGLVTNVIEEERITTTVPKAKAAKPLVERLITLAKEDNLHARRQAAAFLVKPEAVKKLFDKLGPRFHQRNGGYTRIVKLGWRKGDGAPNAKLELVGSELIKRAAERAARREERLKQLRAGQEGEESKEQTGFSRGTRSGVPPGDATRRLSAMLKQPQIHSTTILCVRRDGKVVLAGDGQVTMGSEVVKGGARKLRRLFNGKIISGFAGSTADAFALFSRFESKLEQHSGNLARSVVELAKDWRTDRILRHLEALLLVADAQNIFIVSGTGDVIEPDSPVAAIGSGGAYAKCAALALLENTNLSAREIVEKAMKIAGDVCIYTNGNVTYEELS